MPDMQATIELCNRIETLWQTWKTLDFSLNEALSAAATVRYGRCFKSGVRDRLPEEALKAAPDLLQDTHRFVLDLRDKHVAHSVNPFEENDVTVQIGDHFALSAEIVAINTAHGRAVGFPSDKPAQLRALAEWWIAWLKGEMEEEKALLLQLARTFSLEVLKGHGQPILASDTSPRTVGKTRARP